MNMVGIGKLVYVLCMELPMLLLQINALKAASCGVITSLSDGRNRQAAHNCMLRVGKMEVWQVYLKTSGHKCNAGVGGQIEVNKFSSTL